VLILCRTVAARASSTGSSGATSVGCNPQQYPDDPQSAAQSQLDHFALSRENNGKGTTLKLGIARTRSCFVRFATTSAIEFAPGHRQPAEPSIAHCAPDLPDFGLLTSCFNL